MAKRTNISRRNFLRASASAMAATSVYGLAGCAPNATQSAATAVPTAAAATAPAAEAAPAQNGKLKVAWIAQQ